MTTAELPLWKGVTLGVLVFGGLGILLALVPAYSEIAAVFAFVLSLAGVAITSWGIRARKWWLQLAYWAIFLLFFMGMALRAWQVLLNQSSFGLVAISMILLHVLAWAFPWIFPRLSAWMAQEQLTPATRAGRFVQSFSMGLIPGIGGLVYLVQRLIEGGSVASLDTLLIAVIGSALAVGGPQAISHQYWEKKPWATPSAK